jgi:proline racemase
MGWRGVRPFITGRAYMTADSTLLIDEQDPLPGAFEPGPYLTERCWETGQ